VAPTARARPAEALEPILAPHAGLHLRQSLQSRRRNLLIALHAGAIFTCVHAVERRRQTVHALQHKLPRREADLPALAGLDPVDLVGEEARVPDRPRPLPYRDRAIQLAKS